MKEDSYSSEQETLNPEHNPHTYPPNPLKGEPRPTKLKIQKSKLKTRNMKKIISTPNAPQAIGPYSQAVVAGNLIFISGQVPIDPETGKLIINDITAQTEQVMKNLEAILTEAGCSFKNVVKTTCLLNDISNFKAMNEVYGKYFPENPPARAAFAVKDLPLGALVEIEAVAVKE